MLVNKVVQLAVLAAATLLWETRTDAATATFKLCGRKLSEFMSRLCHEHNSPPWVVPTVVEQQAAAVRRKRSVGIADECCTAGCSWSQLSDYCAISANSESPLDTLEAHMIADRSAEQDSGVKLVAVPTAVGNVGQGIRKGRIGQIKRNGARREKFVKNASRAAPVVGTVSPLLTWGRTLNTDLPQFERNRYAYVAVYTT